MDFLISSHIYIFTCYSIHIQLLYESTGNEKPTLRELLKFFTPYAYMWKRFAVNLDFLHYQIETIQANNQSDVRNALSAMLQHWLTNARDTTWDTILLAFDNLPLSSPESKYQGM